MPFVPQQSEKCGGCKKTVYPTERIVVENSTNVRTAYHKSCLRCETCNKILDLGSYSSVEEKFFCKPHYKQLFLSKGNYSDAFGVENAKDKFAPSAQTLSPSQQSFIPVNKETIKPASGEATQTSEETAAKFRRFRETGNSDKCQACDKTVYFSEKIVVEDKKEKRLFHKACFKCATCGILLDLRNFGYFESNVYCKNHLKELTSKVDTSKPTYVTTGAASFIPAIQAERREEKGETPSHVAAKFKSSGAGADKCKACGKTVYATEKTSIDDFKTKTQSVFHKQCLKCSFCNIQLDVSNFGSNDGIIYCQTHLKQQAKPTQVKSENAFFVSPLRRDTDNEPSQESGYGANESSASVRRDDEAEEGPTEAEEPRSSYQSKPEITKSGASEAEDEEVPSKNHFAEHPPLDEVSLKHKHEDEEEEQGKQPEPEPAPAVESVSSSSSASTTDAYVDRTAEDRAAERERRRAERAKQVAEEEAEEDRQREERRRKREEERAARAALEDA